MKKLILIVGIGLLLTGCSAVEDTTPKDSEPPASTGGQKPQETTEPEESNCEASWGSIDCTFGQTALYEDSRRSGETVKLEITVKAPQAFRPSKDADYAIATLGGETTPGPDNLYFDVTIKNESKVETLHKSDIQIVANSALDSDSDVRYILDKRVDDFWDAELKPGQSATMRSGWNFSDATDPEFNVRVDGLGGNTAKFTAED